MDRLTLAISIGVVLYLLSCAVWPYARCPWCGDKRKRTDGAGHYRLRGPCWLCGGVRYRRLGARLLGRG